MVECNYNAQQKVAVVWVPTKPSKGTKVETVIIVVQKRVSDVCVCVTGEQARVVI